MPNLPWESTEEPWHRPTGPPSGGGCPLAKAVLYYDSGDGNLLLQVNFRFASTAKKGIKFAPTIWSYN